MPFIRWLSGLGVWFLLWVQEVPGSNPGWAHYFENMTLIACFFLQCISVVLFALVSQWEKKLFFARVVFCHFSPHKKSKNSVGKWKLKLHVFIACYCFMTFPGANPINTARYVTVLYNTTIILNDITLSQRIKFYFSLI